jgi:hypothetical protein
MEPINVGALSAAYRRLVLWVGVQLVFAVTGELLIESLEPSWFAIVLSLANTAVVLTSIVMLSIQAFRTAKALGSRVGLLWAIAMVIPLVNLITLLALSSKATRACRKAGIPVGLLGPKMSPNAREANDSGSAG